MIKGKIEPECIFSFTTVESEDVLRKTKKLKCSTGTTTKRHSN